MDDPLLTGGSVLNAVAVWFLLKAVEVAVFVIYDLFTASLRCVRNARDAEMTYDRRRGYLEFVFSGGGFLNLDLWREKKPLLSISTLVPLAVFVLELMSIILGSNTSQCIQSKDPNVVKAPALVLFGQGKRHANLPQLFGDTTRPLSFVRPCITWSSTDSGVEYLSSICAADGSFDHGIIAGQINLEGEIRASIFKKINPSYVYPVLVEFIEDKGFPFETNSPRLLGTHKFTSEVIVNGKRVLYQNTSIASVISEKAKDELLSDFRELEELVGSVPGEYFENEVSFGFSWRSPFTYAIGVRSLLFAVLAQSTEEPIKTAAEMSDLNVSDDPVISFDVYCEDDFTLPRKWAIVIIFVALVFRLILIFIPSPPSSVEYALRRAAEEEDAYCIDG